MSTAPSACQLFGRTDFLHGRRFVWTECGLKETTKIYNRKKTEYISNARPVVKSLREALNKNICCHCHRRYNDQYPFKPSRTRCTCPITTDLWLYGLYVYVIGSETLCLYQRGIQEQNLTVVKFCVTSGDSQIARLYIRRIKPNPAIITIKNKIVDSLQDLASLSFRVIPESMTKVCNHSLSIELNPIHM